MTNTDFFFPRTCVSYVSKGQLLKFSLPSFMLSHNLSHWSSCLSIFPISLHLLNSHFPMSLQDLCHNPLTLCQTEPFKIKICLAHTCFLDIWLKYYLFPNLCSLKLQQIILLKVRSFQICSSLSEFIMYQNGPSYNWYIHYRKSK